jgi:hypothetical protein
MMAARFIECPGERFREFPISNMLKHCSVIRTHFGQLRYNGSLDRQLRKGAPRW